MLNIDQLVSNLTGYVEARLALAKVEIEAELKQALTKFIYFAILALFGLLGLLFLSVAIANILNSVIGSTFLGYLIVAFLYMSIFALLAYFREHPKLQAQIDRFVSRFFKTQHNKSKTNEYQ